MKTSVEGLLSLPFSNRTYADRLRIVADGKPLDITLLIKTPWNIDITVSNVKWLTRCADGFRLFCWPCLLFAKFVGIWNNTGYTDVAHLNEETQKHECERSHIFYDMQLRNVLQLINNKPIPIRPSGMVRTYNQDKAKLISCISRGIVNIICNPEKLNQASGVPECLQLLVKRDIVVQKTNAQNIRIKCEVKKKRKLSKKNHKIGKSEFKIIPIESLITAPSQPKLDSDHETSSDSDDQDTSADFGKDNIIKQEIIHDSYMQDNEQSENNDLPEENAGSSYIFASPSIKHEALNIEFD